MAYGLINSAISSSKHETKVSLIYSSNEVSYNREIKDLIDYMACEGIKMELYDEKYMEHSDIGKHFIPYLKNVNLNDIV